MALFNIFPRREEIVGRALVFTLYQAELAHAAHLAIAGGRSIKNVTVVLMEANPEGEGWKRFQKENEGSEMNRAFKDSSGRCWTLGVMTRRDLATVADHIPRPGIRARIKSKPAADQVRAVVFAFNGELVEEIEPKKLSSRKKTGRTKTKRH